MVTLNVWQFIRLTGDYMLIPLRPVSFQQTNPASWPLITGHWGAKSHLEPGGTSWGSHQHQDGCG